MTQTPPMDPWNRLAGYLKQNSPGKSGTVETLKITETLKTTGKQRRRAHQKGKRWLKTQKQILNPSAEDLQRVDAPLPTTDTGDDAAPHSG